ncbi:MAG: hypothetical protein HXY46_12080 [Syntrophaceae bacterium]|nr:hypothetical protein [Syntrophaceae bacterium]
MGKGAFFILGEGRGWSLPILCLMISILFAPAHGLPGSTDDPLIQLLTPLEGTEVISKKPAIRCSISTPFDPQKLLVILDGTDISGILDLIPGGFEYRPTMILPSGHHTLIVTAYAMDGRELRREFAFSTRHYKSAEEAYSSNEITVLYEKLLGKSDDATNQPSWKTESNLASESKLKEKEWELSFKTNLRYFERNLPATDPTNNGLNLANYLFQGKYNGNRLNFLSEIGDVQINETPNTVQGLARRGGNLVFQSKDLHLQLRTFAVRSEQVIGFKGGLGIEGTKDDHIMGFSGDVGLISDKVRFRTIYITGGEESGSFGISTTGGEKRGDVLGFLLTTDFLKQRLTTEAELDFSRFDADTKDEFSREEDKAYRLKVGGVSGNYTYEGFYEYMGPDYEVIGNQGLQKNREGFTLKTGASFPIHSINLSFSRYNDNVENDDLYPVTYTTQGTVDYSLNKIKALPIGLSYQKSRIETKDEPLETLPIETDTDTVTGKINYIKGPWNLGFSTSYSLQNDRTSQDNDTTTVTYTLTPTYTQEHFSLSPSFSLNRTRNHLTRVYTDTYTTALDLRGDIFRKKLTYGLAGTYNIIRASDDTTKQDTLSTNFNISYLLFKNLWGFLNPSIGIRGLYNRTNDKVLGQTTNELALFLVIQTTMPFSF